MAMSEQNPNQQPDEVILDIAGHGEFLMTRYNTRLFTFLGNLSTRDHIFIALDEPEEGVTRGAYVFSHSDSYTPIFTFMVDHEYPMSLNNIHIEENDETAFQRSLEQLEGFIESDTIPEGWEDS